CERSKLRCNAAVLAYPDRLGNDGDERRDPAQRDPGQHHLVGGDKRTITSNEGVPLNIPTGSQERDKRAEQSNQPACQTQGDDRVERRGVRSGGTQRTRSFNAMLCERSLSLFISCYVC